MHPQEIRRLGPRHVACCGCWPSSGLLVERVLYCEHGNQFDPANTIKEYEDPLDTPLGDHIVTDRIRQIVPEGRITRSFDLRDVNKVYPLVTIPEWVVGRFFYDLLGRVVTYLLLPLIIGYATYWVVEYLLTLAQGLTALVLLGELSYVSRAAGAVRGDRHGREPTCDRVRPLLPGNPRDGGTRGLFLVTEISRPSVGHPVASDSGARDPRSADDRPAATYAPLPLGTGHRRLRLGAHSRPFALRDPTRGQGRRDHRELRLLAKETATDPRALQGAARFRVEVRADPREGLPRRLRRPRGALGTSETCARASANCGANLDPRSTACATRRGRRAASECLERSARSGVEAHPRYRLELALANS
jgi:hypothetical protein